MGTFESLQPPSPKETRLWWLFRSRWAIFIHVTSCYLRAELRIYAASTDGASPIWPRVCCIFLSHSGSVPTVDLSSTSSVFKPVVPIKRQTRIHISSLPSLFSVPPSLLSPTEHLQIFSEKCICIVIPWYIHGAVTEHDRVPGVLFDTRSNKAKKTMYLPLKRLQSILFGEDHHGSKKMGDLVRKKLGIILSNLYS